MAEIDACEVIAKAKTLLIEYGWVQGTMHNPYGYCAVGAINQVVNQEIRTPALSTMNSNEDWTVAFKERARQRNRLTTEIFRKIEQTIGRGGDGSGDNIVGWNDSPERTKDEVIEAFEKACA